MKVLMVGGGGREHALVWKLAQSSKVTKIFCAPGNGGIAELAECADIAATDIGVMVAFAQEKQVDLVFVAPDDPLVLGMVDAMEAVGIRAFGPQKNAAILEGSKSFAKDFMKKYNVPTAAYATFTDPEAAKATVREWGAPIVVKADGLALGKGVVIAMTQEEAYCAVDDMLVSHAFGKSGDKVVLEKYMTGPEVSVLCFTDGKTIVPMLSAQDHKRIFDDDKGPNTGGMGAFAPSPKYTPSIAQEVMDTIILPTLRGMEAEGRLFKGVLYFGLMLTQEGPKVIEYNVRFGDPEAQAVIPMLESDLVDIVEAILQGKLDALDIRWKEGAAVTVVMASKGYPGSIEKGFSIQGIEDAEALGCSVFQAGTAKKNGGLETAGGRVLGVTAVSESFEDAIVKAYAGVSKINFHGAQFRKDIGKK